MESFGEVINKTNFRRNHWQGRMEAFTMVQNSLIFDDRLNIYEKMVLIVLEAHKIKKTICWPSQRRIAKMARCSVTTVKKTISNLEEKRLLIKIPDNKKRSTVYSSTTNIRKTPSAQVSGRETSIE